jgi:sulfite exporter TauE/SafE
MATFGLGTVPLLAALAVGVRLVGARTRLSMYRAAAIFALAMGVQLCMRGMAGLEWVPHAHLLEVVLW